MGASELTTSLGSLSVGGARDAGSQEQLAPLRNMAGEATSPFVRSFSNSPVAWQPLNNATIERAKKEHKLIFLHIGYKTCHHCHLMMQESFSNTECAAILSDAFIPVVIDKDERPDLDTIYMNYIQAISNGGGWPLNLFLTPNMEPVFGGTYLPGPGAAGRGARNEEEELVDFLSILKKLRNIWGEQEARCRKEATEVVTQLREFAAEGTLGTRTVNAATIRPNNVRTPSSHEIPRIERSNRTTSSELDLDQLEEAYSYLAGTYDPSYAGFGLAPKFVLPPKLNFLLRLATLPSEVNDIVGKPETNHAVLMALATLRKVVSCSMHDHLGGGFFRCAVTFDWSVPNFEKLVVDNGLLLSLYTEAWLQSGGLEESEFFEVVLELGNYLSSSPITLPCGGFATGEAADSYYRREDKEMQEGGFYVWQKRDFEAIANPFVTFYFGLVDNGNLGSHNDDFVGLNVLNIRSTVEEACNRLRVEVKQAKSWIRDGKAALKERRDKDRVRPELDDKVVTGWNGLVISGLAKAASGLKLLRPEESRKYISAASKAVSFIKENLWDAETKTLYRIWKDRKSTKAFADDYAYLIQGLLDLFGATGDKELVEFANVLQKTQIFLFYDPAGAFYSTTEDSPHSILRLKEGMDTSLPSTNSVSVSNLFRLSTAYKEEDYVKIACDTVNAFEAEILQHPWLFPGLLTGLVTARLGVEKQPELHLHGMQEEAK